MITPPHDLAVIYDDRADHGIRARRPPALRGEAKRQGHVVEISVFSGHRLLREAAFDLADLREVFAAALLVRR